MRCYTGTGLVTRTDAGKNSLATAPTYISDGEPGCRPAAASRWLYPALILLAWALVYVPGLASPPLLDDADAVHAEAAREMLVSGDYVTPHVDGVRYLDYAPLMYWTTAAGYKLFGVSEFGTRLPLALFVLALLISTYICGRDCFGPTGGLWAALVLATAVGPYLFTRFLLPDIIIGLWLTVTATLFLRALAAERPTRAQCWGIAAMCALGTLTKGLMGVVFPLAIMVGYLLVTGNLRKLLQFRLLSSLAVFFVIAAPWHIAAILRNPPQGDAKGFFWFYFINEQINRYLNRRIPRDYDKVRLWLFWALLALWVFPWCVYLVQALRKIPLKAPWRSSALRQPRVYFAVWALFILVFFSFSTRQEYYTISAVPALALLLGGWLAEEESAPAGSPVRRSGIIGTAFLFGVGLIGGAVALFLAVRVPSPPAGTDLSALLKADPSMYALSMGHFFDLTLVAFGAFKIPLAITGLALLGGCTAALLLRLRGYAARSNYVLVLMMAVLFFAVHLALGVFSPVLGSKPLAEQIERQYRPGDLIVIDGEYSLASTVNFYTAIPIHLMNGKRNALWFGSLYPDCPKIFEDEDSLTRRWRGEQRIFLIVFNEARVGQMREKGPVRELLRSGGKILLTNR